MDSRSPWDAQSLVPKNLLVSPFYYPGFCGYVRFYNFVKFLGFTFFHAQTHRESHFSGLL